MGLSGRFGRSLRRRLLEARARRLEAQLPGPHPMPSATPELRVIFVCLGNICRSPLAEAVFRSKLEERGLLERVAVASAGTRAAPPPHTADARTRVVAARHGVVVGPRAARPFGAADYGAFDWIVVFDRSNLADVEQIVGREVGPSRAFLLGENGAEVVDPIAGRLSDFEHAFRQIDEGTDRLVERVELHLARRPK